MSFSFDPSASQIDTTDYIFRLLLPVNRCLEVFCKFCMNIIQWHIVRTNSLSWYTPSCPALNGYSYSSGSLKDTIKTSSAYSLLVAACGTVLLYIFAAPITGSFISDMETGRNGQDFLKIICLAYPTIAVKLTCITVYQTIGRKVQPLFLPRFPSRALTLCLCLNRHIGISGIAWTTPFAGWIIFIISMVPVILCSKSLNGERAAAEGSR